MKISQTEARRLKRRVAQLESVLEEQARRWAATYIGGVTIATQTYNDSRDFLPAVVHNSRQLGHAVVVVCDDSTLRYVALPHPKVKP